MLARIALLLMLSPGAVGAQEVIDLSSFERCRACELELILDLRLGDPDLPGAIESESARVVFDEVYGNYAVFHRGGTHVQLFDPEGSFEAVLSREGGGPGELRALADVAFADGDIVMVDARARKLVVMSRSGQLVADTRIDLSLGEIRVISADTVVIASMDTRPDLVGYPLHLVSLSDGAVLGSFGSLTGEWDATAPFSRLVLLGKSPADRSVWRGYLSGLRLEEWGLDGSLIRAFTGDFDWCPPVLRDREGPPSYLFNFATDREDRLWLLTRVPDPNWRSVQPQRLGPETLIRREDYDEYYDIRLDVFDLRTEEHLGTVRWDEARVFLTSHKGNALIHLVEYDEEMVPRVALYRVNVESNR